MAARIAVIGLDFGARVVSTCQAFRARRKAGDHSFGHSCQETAFLRLRPRRIAFLWEQPLLLLIDEAQC